MASVHFEGVSHRRPGDFDALVGLDVDVHDGEAIAFVGTAGSGAATALRLLAGFEDPARGSIRIGMRDLAGLPPRDRNVALVLPHHALYAQLTAAEHLVSPLVVAKVPEAELTARVREVAGRLRLDGLLDRHPRELSATERQRVAMGRAIVRRPDVLLMDDPLAGLDAEARFDVRADLRRLLDELATTTIAVVADAADGVEIGDRVVRFEGGRCSAPALTRVPAGT